MAIHKLKPRFPETVKTKGMYPDGGGLYLQVGAEGAAKSWLFRYNVAGRDRQMGLGPLHTIGLAQARELARQCREQRLQGVDPIEARKTKRLDDKLAAAKDVSFQHCAEQWMKSQEVVWSSQNYKRIARTFRIYVYSHIGNLPVQKINVDLLHKLLDPIHKQNPPTYTIVQMCIEGALNLAHAKGYIPPGTPAALKSALKLLLPPVDKFHVVKHHESLPWHKIGEFMRDLRAYRDTTNPRNHATNCKVCHSPHRSEIEAAIREGGSLRKVAARFGLKEWNIYEHKKRDENEPADTRPVAAYALEFLILTGVRREQAVSARWEDIDEQDWVWDCPPEAHKTGKKTGQYHIVPLSTAAVAVLKKMKELQANGHESEFVFPAQMVTSRSGHLSATAINRLQKDFLGRTDCVPHGFRTTFKSWAIEKGYPEQDSEMTLAHKIGDDTRNVYARHAERIEPRRVMMNDWAEWCDRAEPLDAKVTTDLAARRAARRAARMRSAK